MSSTLATETIALIRTMADANRLCAPPSRREERIRAHRLLNAVEEVASREPETKAYLEHLENQLDDHAEEEDDPGSRARWKAARSRLDRRLAAAGIRGDDDDDDAPARCRRSAATRRRGG